jgi:hypothetical protein
LGSHSIAKSLSASRLVLTNPVHLDACIITDAYQDKVGWYARYGFLPLEGAAAGAAVQKMFLDVRTIRRASSIESSPADRD